MSVLYWKIVWLIRYENNNLTKIARLLLNSACKSLGSG